MGQLTLSRQGIKADIQGYELRIRITRDKLATMAHNGDSYKERKRLKAERHKLRGEINHVSVMMSYARRALAELVTGDAPWMLKKQSAR